ncbi:sulfotransferase [Streptosporangium sp. NPDC049304]|uniref:sulfotransferase n=1 Tax=Streptosporangium sp. NPDC049304 TaxID=3154830 RepID=UPI003412AACD
MFGGRPKGRATAWRFFAPTSRRCGRPFRRKSCSYPGRGRAESLCQCLGAPIPDMPFPQANERAAYHRKRPHQHPNPIVQG